MSATELERRFEQVEELLYEYQAFWQEEVLSRYPEPFEDFPEEWLTALDRLDFEALYRVEHRGEFDLPGSPSLAAYFERAKAASTLAKEPQRDTQHLNKRLFNGVSAKKEHEIRALTGFIRELLAADKVNAIADYAGGIGYLAQVLAASCNLPVRTMDRDNRLQRQGIERAEKLGQSLEYINLNLEDGVLQPRSAKELNVGLHTCGSLAVHLLHSAVSVGTSAVLNFGCCYYKTATPNLHLSAQAAKKALRLTSPALTLASRSHRDTARAYYLSKRVKQFRYTIHLFLYHELGLRDFVGLGNSSKHLYAGSFSDYAREQLRRLGLEVKISTEQLENFYEDPKHRQTVRRMISANIIRSRLGRSIEVYVLLDRALFLAEQGYEVKAVEFFDETISPRNIGIYATC